MQCTGNLSKLIEVALARLLWKNGFVYINDVVVCSNTFEERLTHLKKVLTRLRQAGLRLKAKKCMFLREEVPYLGHAVINSGGIEPDPAATEKIRHYPAPGVVSQVQQFLGLASYYWRFVPKIAAPLHLLLKKDAEFQWSPDSSKIFRKPERSSNQCTCAIYSLPSVQCI